MLLVVYALVYFLPFYASKLTKPSPNLTRDAPSVIRARIASVTLSCSFCSIATLLILVKEAHAPVLDALHLLGVWPVGLADTLKTLFLTSTLFLGPLFSHFVVEAGWREWLTAEPVKELWSEWTAWRNIVAVCISSSQTSETC